MKYLMRLDWMICRQWLKLTKGELRCGCHWNEMYGPVIMAGCRRHD